MQLKRIIIVLALALALATPARAVDIASLFGNPAPLPVVCTFQLSQPQIHADGVDALTVTMLLNGTSSSTPVNVTIYNGSTSVVKNNVVFPIANVTSTMQGVYTFSAAEPSGKFSCPSASFQAIP